MATTIGYHLNFEKIAKVHKQSADNPYGEALQDSKTPTGGLSTASLNS